MEPETLFANFRESLEAIIAPRFYETERGFQGELLTQLSKRLRLSDPAIVEQEYQKRQHVHGLSIRPDLIIHEPFDLGHHSSRTEGNIAVVELKLNASANKAAQAFQSLAAMLNVLEYPIGIFVNIGTTETYADLVPQEVKGRIALYAVSLNESHVYVVEERT